jgi:hypothetical protein
MLNGSAYLNLNAYLLAYMYNKIALFFLKWLFLVVQVAFLLNFTEEQSYTLESASKMIK